MSLSTDFVSPPSDKADPHAREVRSSAQETALYDSHASAWWDDSVPWLRTLQNLCPARLRYFDRYVESWDEKAVLDLGCGGGFMAEALAKRGANVVGVDPAMDAIAAARQHAGSQGLSIDYRVGTAETLNAEDASFDHVVCVDVLEHVTDLDVTLDQIARVTRPGGIFAFDTINRTLLSRLVVITAAEQILRILPRGTHDPALFVSPKTLRAKLDARGFDVLNITGLGPTGLNRRLDFTFGALPITWIQYMGVARRRPNHAT